jgi:hypothetical protein
MTVQSPSPPPPTAPQPPKKAIGPLGWVVAIGCGCGVIVLVGFIVLAAVARLYETKEVGAAPASRRPPAASEVAPESSPANEVQPQWSAPPVPAPPTAPLPPQPLDCNSLLAQAEATCAQAHLPAMLFACSNARLRYGDCLGYDMRIAGSLSCESARDLMFSQGCAGDGSGVSRPIFLMMCDNLRRRLARCAP